MRINQYDVELDKLAETYRAALAINVDRIKAAIAAASESSIIGVGSGGSYTVASLLCNLHETYTGRISRPSTPLEIICNPTLASACPVFLISAEGKNPDIIEALLRARRHSARAVHVVTNRAESPLISCARQLTDITSHVFELSEKDGYLATNSLLMDAVLMARAYGELDQEFDHVPQAIDGLQIGNQSIDEWLSETGEFVEKAIPRKGLIVVYSPLLQPIAADLESKLSEAALLYCQLADLRSFAHGRHLWLADRSTECSILALIEPSLQNLWNHMRGLIPAEIPTLTMNLAGAKPRDLIAGVIAQMRLIGLIAHHSNTDPGRPAVQQFGRDLYYVDLQNYIAETVEPPGSAEQSKYEAFGAHWPSLKRQRSISRAVHQYRTDMERQRFRAIVFDYDGTLCSSQRNDAPPSAEVLTHIRKLIEADIVVGIASGRGGSIREQLQSCLPTTMWQKIKLGLYSGGWIGDVSISPPDKRQTSEFLSHVARIVGRLKDIGVPIEGIRTTHPFQVSIRFREGIHTAGMWFVIADALRQAGLDLSSMVRSKHSVDVLAEGVGKARLIAHIIDEHKVDPYQVLTMGDQGAWPGNDSALLEHRHSLSVDQPSRRLDRGWKIAPAHKRDVDATLWYLDCIRPDGNGAFTINFPANTESMP